MLNTILSNTGECSANIDLSYEDLYISDQLEKMDAEEHKKKGINFTRENEKVGMIVDAI
jgi:hypothetical protein